MNISKRLESIIEECRQAICDGESWADNRPEEKPIDIEGFRVIKMKATACLAANNEGDFRRMAELLSELADMDENDR